MVRTRCECGNRKDYRAELCRRCAIQRGRLSLWKRSDCIRALENWVEQHGIPPTYREWETAEYGRPTSLTCCKVFGTWTKFLEAGGHKAGRAGGKPYWTKKQIADAMLDFVAREKRWPTTWDWRRAHPNGLWPPERVVYRRFNTWDEAQRYAGREVAA